MAQGQIHFLVVAALLHLSWLIVTCVRAQSLGVEQERSKTNVTFCLYTHNSGPEEMFTNDLASMNNPNFDRCAETIFMITGLNQIDDHPDLISGSKEIAAKFFNVIVVNFYTDSYLQEVSHTATEISKFIQSLEFNAGVNPNHISLIGISLGAHIAGAVGKRYRVSRIIGLDPSGPIYDLLSPEDRLDASDAELVDVVHSSKVFGTRLEEVGHVSFVINGGQNQPNCEPFDFYCHHVRASFVFLASVTSCEIYFRQCFAYWAFKLGLCNMWPRLKIGLDLKPQEAKRKPGRYYYDTATDNFPFCSKREQRRKPKLHPLFC